jgi:hypothetical protein
MLYYNVIQLLGLSEVGGPPQCIWRLSEYRSAHTRTSGSNPEGYEPLITVFPNT